MMKKKILITGGHLTPSLAVIAELNKRKNFDIYYVGRKYALEGDKAESLEYKTINKLGITFILSSAARLQRTFTIYTIPSLFRMPYSLFVSLYQLLKIKPDLIISFGGYVALPIGIAAIILNIPLVLHEQTAVLGLSNKILSKFAKVLFLSWEDTKGVPANVRNTIFTGNPIRPDFLSKKDKSLVNFGNKKFPLIYITGGSLGSRSINKVVKVIISDLVKSYRVLHQCGLSDNESDFKELSEVKNKLTPGLKINYKVIPNISPKYIGNLLESSNLIIGRSGANTVTEIAYLEKPAIFIPLPWAGGNEQYENALKLKKQIGSKIILQKDLNGKILLNSIKEMIAESNTDKNKSYPKLHVAQNPASKIADIITGLI